MTGDSWLGNYVLT